MDDATIRKLSRKLSRPHRIERGGKFRLKDHDPRSTGELGDGDKAGAEAMLEEGKAALARMQEMLYAQDRWSVLVVFQAMDAAGKDGAIKHVMSGVNPQGCQVHSFKAPSHEELDHDFLWRCACRLPERGRIGIFNRSYYEEVLVVKVHPEFLEPQRIPPRSSASACGTSATRTSARSSATSRVAAPWSSSSSCTSRARSSAAASSSASRSATRTGSSRPPTCASARTGTRTWTPTRR
jgi:hypothetical protein